ncbi:DUF4870 domain-containing protein [Protaetiibacter mangrovi]|uniref:DUF4870 domain-containing protein n=1 Tax=Protaetiibacter mangrovi TaxID=2970926 RepID=A0ABT1ZEZ3_9MICO|nr:DUF4870 domain-containing protein [Protaetiibacter mangrovi]MCS0499249.1 DUF4870 domain-containing protein [Protaetiibacter mangrovi]TPW99386.1 DUF4870 domain-containing protein [Schumannella luteola]
MTATPPPPPTPDYAPTAEMSPADQRLWSTLTHVGGILFSWLAPLITYLVLKDRGAFVRAHTATALNFQLTLLIAYIVGSVLSVIIIGFLVLLAAWVLSIIFGIMAAIAANKGEFYTYPMSIKFVS